MIPFRMQCPGCHANVVVKHKELLGKSLPCPKCKQPIVVPNQGPISPLSNASSREPAPSFDSTAITKEDYGDWEEVLSNLPQNPLGVDPEQIDWSSLDTSGSSVEPPIPFQPIDIAPPQPSTASDWQDKNVKKRRQLLLVVTIGLLSSLLAGIGFFSFLSFVKNDNSAQTKNDNATVVDQASTPKDSGGNANSSNPGDEEADPTTPQSNDLPKDTKSEPLASDSGNSGPVVIPSPNLTEKDGKQSESVNPSEGNGNAQSDAVAANDPALPADSKTDLAQSAVNDQPEELTYKLPPELARVRDLLNNSRSAVGSDAGFRPPASVDELNLENLQYPQMSVFHPDAKSLGDWKQVTALSIPRMSAPSDVKLAIGLEEFGRLTNIGITIDWQACRTLGVEANPLISMKFENKSVAGFLEETLQAKGLVLNLDPKGFPVVQPIARPDLPAESYRWEIKDVCADGFEKETADLLIAMCEVKEFCTQDNGALVWSVDASVLDRAKMYDTLRHLAKIKGKPIPNWPGTETFKEMLFSVEAWKDSRNVLTKALSPDAIMSESRPAISLLQGVAKMVDAQIIVDWKSAWEHGLTPTETSISVLRNRTLVQISKKILVEYALELIPIDSRTFWLTTGRVRQTNLIVVPIKPPAELNLDLVKRTLSKLRPLGSDELSRFQMRPVPGMEGAYFARICLPNTSIILQDEFESVFGWE